MKCSEIPRDSDSPCENDDLDYDNEEDDPSYVDCDNEDKVDIFDISDMHNPNEECEEVEKI
ncbi:19699_t:CDS:2, partial [Gigaspora rosea]